MTWLYLFPRDGWDGEENEDVTWGGLFGTGYERVFVDKNLSVEGITGEDGFIQDALKFTDKRGVKNSRPHEFHDYKELIFVFGNFLAYVREIFTTTKDIVWRQNGNFLHQRGCGLFEKAVLRDRVIKIHFYGLHLLSFPGG